MYIKVSQSTVQRWLKNPIRKTYQRRRGPLQFEMIVDILLMTIINTPLSTLGKLQYIIKPGLGENTKTVGLYQMNVVPEGRAT
jgi:hypothetical protein